MNECADTDTRTLLHDYELNHLNDNDRERFEEHLMSCPFCASEVQSMQKLSTVLLANREAVLEALREDGLTFDRIRRRLSAPRETVWERLAAFLGRYYGRTALVGAVAMAVLLGVLLWPQASDNPYLADLSFELPPYQSGLELRGETHDQAAMIFETAMASYRTGDYPAAIAGIRNALELDPNQPERWLYLGVSQYATHDARGALRSLKKADADSQGLTKLRTRWYLAQAYLYLSKPGPARPLLEWVVAQNGEHSGEAQRLLTLMQGQD